MLPSRTPQLLVSNDFDKAWNANAVASQRSVARTSRSSLKAYQRNLLGASCSADPRWLPQQAASIAIVAAGKFAILDLRSEITRTYIVN
jgi:hypothetical protein